MKKFIHENGLIEIHEIVNNIEDDIRDHTHKTGSKQIDAVLVTSELTQSIVGCKLTDFNDIINTDHRGFIFDIDIKDYFDVDSSKYNENQAVILDPTRRSHQEKFKEKLEEYID